MTMDLDCLCRTCMHELAEACEENSHSVAEQPQQQWPSIFDIVPEFGTLRIFELLSATIPQLEVLLNDKLPKKMCNECMQQLISLYHFQKICIHSDEKMRELLTRKYEDIKIETPEPHSPVGDRMSKSSCTLQEPIIEAREGSECIDDLAKTAEVIIKDPLQNINHTTEHLMEVDVSACLKLELHDDDSDVSSVDYDDFERRTPYLLDTNLKLGRINPKTTVYEEVITSSDESNDTHSDWTPNNSTRKEDANGETVNQYFETKSSNTTWKVELGATPNTYSCNLCEKSFNARRYLMSHLKRHEKADERNKLSYKCDICNQNFSKLRLLDKHRLIHDKRVTTPASYSCNLCEKTYGFRRSLNRHKRQKHNMEEKTVYACKFCDKSFQLSDSLKNHLRTHTNQQSYLCSECGKSFNSSSILKQHLLRHADVKLYKCPECPKEFPCRSNLVSHKAVHLSIRPHVYDICSAAFGTPYLLKKHKMYHNGEKPYKCEYCEMRFLFIAFSKQSFVSKENQRRHMRTHTGERPYKCKYCEGAFAQSNDLTKHLRTHLGKNVYKCELCPSGFSLATELREHFAQHNNDDQQTREQNMKALMEDHAKFRLNLLANKNN